MDPDEMFRLRLVGGPVAPDTVQECTVCGALVLHDGAAMTRHWEFHARLDRTLP